MNNGKGGGNMIKGILKNATASVAGFLGAIGIIFGPLVIFCIVMWVISLFSNQNKPDEPTAIEYVKSSEQKRYEQECIDVNVALQEDPDIEYKIEKGLIVSYCGCMGDSLFPKGSEKAIFPKRSTSYQESLDGEKDISDVSKVCRIQAFTQKDDEAWTRHGWVDSSYEGELSHTFGDSEYIREYIKDYIHEWMHGYWNEHRYSVSIDIPCVQDNIYDKVPPYYVETVFMNGKIVSAIRACSEDPRIEDFLDF